MRKTKKIKLNDSIAILESVKINDLDQYLRIRGNNINNPLMLFLHGGPGGAQIAYARTLQQELEKDFIVVQWDQRGAGLSYVPGMTTEDLTIDQLVEDTVEITKYLLERFNKDNLILVGHSFGTILGMKAIQRKPEYYSHYYGVGQIGRAADVYPTVMNIMLDKSLNTNHHNKILAIKDPTNLTKKEQKLYQKYVNYYKGGISYQGGFVSKIIFKTIFSKEYNIRDLKMMMQGQLFSATTLENAIRETNLLQEVPSVDVDITFISGKHDLLVPEVISRQYFDVIKSLNKKYYIFENSSHSAHWEEHDKFLNIIKER